MFWLKIKNKRLNKKQYQTLKKLKQIKYSLIEIKPLTGRKHQIRKQLLKLKIQ